MQSTWKNSAAAVSTALSMLLSCGAALARTPYRSNPPASPPATSQTAASPALPSASTAAACADGLCQKPAAGLTDLATADALAPDHRYGTALEWLDTPLAAGKEAAAEKKLVFLIQISGNFTRQEFT
ncbi:MAG: hypothetical protein ACREJM_08960 [Candidatus Saccharimonadales bacterium]